MSNPVPPRVESEVKKFWDSQARAHGASSLATMPDQFLKNLEVQSISRWLRPGGRIADIGCGNGYSTFHYAEAVDAQFEGIDYSEAMIETARQTLASRPTLASRVQFRTGDVRRTGAENASFDTVITDRCLINLVSREDQALALKEIHRLLKPKGLYLSCEDTEQGLGNLNKIREVVGLPAIPVRWHNLYLDEQHLRDSAKELFELVEEHRFSSFYYLASRILNGRIAQDQHIDPRYDSDINRVAALCSAAGDFGDFGPLKLFVFRKRASK